VFTGKRAFDGAEVLDLVARRASTPSTPSAHVTGLNPVVDAAIMRCLAKRPADRFQTADELVTVLEPLTASSGGITPTHTQPVPSLAPAPVRKPTRTYAIAGAALLAVVAALFAWKPWARTAAKPLDANVVAVMPFRVAGADPSVQYLRQGMLDLLQAKLSGEGGPRAADTRSVLAAVREAGGTDTQDLDEKEVATVARKIGAGRVLQGSIVGPTDHLVISANLLAMPGGNTVAQTSVTGPRDSLFVLIDRLTAQLLALGAGASQNQLSALTTTNLDALRAYLDGVTAYRRGNFQTATTVLEKAVDLDSTFALALSALIESDGWHGANGDMNRVRRLAWQYRDRLNPQDQLFLTLRVGSNWPRSTPWNVQIADAEKAVQKIPESADAWYYLGDALFHFGAVSDEPDAQGRARRAFEQAVQRDSAYGAPAFHLAALSYAVGDTAAQRLWTARQMALNSNFEGANNARWQLAAATRDKAGISALVRNHQNNTQQ
jgi:serine/threonine-protein kinase